MTVCDAAARGEFMLTGWTRAFRSAAEGAKAAEAIALQYAKAVSEEVKTRNMELAAVEPELPLDRPQRKKV